MSELQAGQDTTTTLRQEIFANVDPTYSASKKQAFDNLSQLIVGIEMLSIPSDIRSMLTSELSVLYRYFSPAVPRTAKTDIQWVSKAVAKNDIRWYLNYLYEGNGRLAGTDGHRAHWVDSDGDRGFMLCPTGDVISCGGKFPNLDNIIPTYEADTLISLSDLEYSTVNNGNRYLSSKYTFPNGQLINSIYLLDAINKEEKFYYGAGKLKDDGVIRISNVEKTRHALIMPLRA